MRVPLFRWHQQIENGCAPIRCTDLSKSENNSLGKLQTRLVDDMSPLGRRPIAT